MSDRLVDANTVAERLGVPVSWVRQTTRAGHLPHVQLGRYVRYDIADVDAWVDGLRQGAGPTFRRHDPSAAR